MEFLVASAIGVMTAAGIYLVLRARTFPVVIGLSLLTYATTCSCSPPAGSRSTGRR